MTLKVIAVNVGLLLGLCGLEVLFGGWVSHNGLAQLAVLRNLSATYDVSHLYESARPHITYTRDQFGLRGAYRSPAEIGILTVGGSTTDQRGIDDTETWQAVLQEEFRRSGNTISVVNAGVDGQSTYGHIKNFDLWFPHVPGLSSEYILFYVGINDFYFGPDSKFDELAADAPPTWLTQFEDRSALYGLFRKLRGTYRAHAVYRLNHRRDESSGKRFTESALIRDHAVVMSDLLAAYAARLRVLARKTEAVGALPIFVTQRSYSYKMEGDRLLGQDPFSVYAGREINGVDHYHMMNLLNRTTLDVCAQMGAVCIDLASELQFDDGDFYDVSHNTPQGAAKIGSYLHSKLRDLK